MSGNLLESRRNGQTQERNEYDRKNHLTNEHRKGTGERYAYDLCSNRLIREKYQNGSVGVTEGYRYNERNELTECIRAGRLTVYHYDKNGSIIS